MPFEREETRRRPTHPGYVVRVELEELGMTVTDAAERLGVSRPSLSPLMALKLGRFFGNGTELWLNMQTRFDRWEVEHDRDARREAERVEPVHA